MHFLPDVYVTCDVCKGKRYNRETLEVLFKGKSIADVLDMTVEEAADFFKAVPRVRETFQTLHRVGLDYIHVGQQATTLSGGEAQRMSLARELSKRQTGRTLYLLDEPTTGLHFDDVRKLLEVLHRLTDLGNTVIIIEHNLDIVRNADYILDLGPEGGERGGQIVAHGSPEQIATVPASHTGQFLARHYKPAQLASVNGTSHAGPQPANIVADPDAAKQPRGKFVAPKKKTGVPEAQPGSSTSSALSNAVKNSTRPRTKKTT
jgi:excinuclease ABC subunit A